MFVRCELDDFLDFSTVKTKGDVRFLQDKLMEEFLESWYIELNRECVKNGHGGNTLRRYRLFKFQYGTEEYLKNNLISYKDRKALAQIKCSSSHLLIETGRYQNGVYLPVDERLCKICHISVEDEFHVLLKCPLYDDLRDMLFEGAFNCNPAFHLLSDVEKFVFIMSSNDLTKMCAKTCKLLLEHHWNFISI